MGFRLSSAQRQWPELSSAQRSSAGNKLLPFGPQVSEDHCWLNMSADGQREGSCEITTDNVPKRALAVDAAAWEGWLYSGGHAVICSPQVRLTSHKWAHLSPLVGLIVP